MGRGIAIALSCALLFTACGGDSDAPREVAKHWLTDAARKAAFGGADDGGREFVPCPMPQAAHGLPDEIDGKLVFDSVVNVLADHTVRITQYEFELTVNPAERPKVESAFRDAVSMVRIQRQRTQHGKKRPILIYAHRDTGWMNVRDVCALVVTKPVAADHLVFGVWPRKHGKELLWRARWKPACEHEPSLTVNLRREKQRGVTVHLSGKLLSAVPETPDWASAQDMKLANVAWSKVDRGLADAARGATDARVEVGSGSLMLRWAHVVKTIDLLMGHGVKRIQLVVADGCLVIERAPRVDPTP